ncbi:hypothetical protein Salat_1775600 [Sesamum alatum]|uniref:Uncharacterized protein n=1 Tax=Sesamum alatum TaxID=300844 RepID=A0AAE1Y8T2_9LAMI|nr:hypothetical protein Salat_1775600 [Sesamum alatum]
MCLLTRSGKEWRIVKSKVGWKSSKILPTTLMMWWTNGNWRTSDRNSRMLMILRHLMILILGRRRYVPFSNLFAYASNKPLERRSIAKNMKGLNGRLDSIDQEHKDEFKFIPNLGRDLEEDEFKRIITTSFVDVSEIHGRDDDKKILVSKLLSGSSSGDGVQTISIVGTGGMGRQLLLNLCLTMSV